MSVETSYAPPGVYTIRPCAETHPITGDGCTLLSIHTNLANDPRERQHVTVNGYKWPDLRILDPSEGFNGPQPRSV